MTSSYVEFSDLYSESLTIHRAKLVATQHDESERSEATVKELLGRVDLRTLLIGFAHLSHHRDTLTPLQLRIHRKHYAALHRRR
jgi:hypothetical protein